MIKKIKNKFKKRKEKRAQIKEFLKSLPSAYDNVEMSWIAPEYPKHKRGKLWIIIIVGLLLAAIILGVMHKAWTFSLAIGVFAIVYFIIHKQQPSDVEVSISDIGIKVGERKYPFPRIKSFWMVYEPPFIKTLNIKVLDEFAVDIAIELNSQDPSIIRNYLIERIPEKEGNSESLSNIFARLFKI
jgi:hypothetical protein